MRPVFYHKMVLTLSEPGSSPKLTLVPTICFKNGKVVGLDINPVIYVLRDKQFRDAARKLFKL